jgi:hypothetical protein
MGAPWQRMPWVEKVVGEGEWHGGWEVVRGSLRGGVVVGSEGAVTGGLC